MKIVFLIILFGLIFPKNKIIAYIEVIAISLFYGCYNGMIDIPNYIWQYRNVQQKNDYIQNLYSLLSAFFHNLGISFEVYHFIITVVSLLVILWVASKITDQIAYVMSMIAVFTYIENGWQLKTMMSTCFIVISLYWFYNRIYYEQKYTIKRNFNIFIYLILIFIASQFHFMAIFFCIFLFIPYIKGHPIKVALADICILAIAGKVLVIVSSYIPMVKNYISPISFLVFVITGIWQILGYVILFYKNNIIQYIENDKFDIFIKDGTLILMLLIPFYYYANVATRIYRVWLIFMIIYVSKLSRRQFIVSLRRVLFDSYVICSSIFWFDIMFRLQGDAPLIYELLNNNFWIN